MLGAVKMSKKEGGMQNRLGRLSGESRILSIYSYIHIYHIGI